MVAIVGGQARGESRRSRPLESNSIMISGIANGIEPGTGRRLWSTPIENQGVNPFQSGDLPIIVFARMRMESRGNRGMSQMASLLCIDSRNGRVLFDQSISDDQFLTLAPQPVLDQQRLEFRLSRSTLELEFTNKPSPPKTPKSPASPPEKVPELLPR